MELLTHVIHGENPQSHWLLSYYQILCVLLAGLLPVEVKEVDLAGVPRACLD